MALDPRRPYSVEKLAKRWNCGEALIRKLVTEGRLPSFRIGTLIRISAVEVDRFEQTGP